MPRPAALHVLRAVAGKSLIYTELDGRYQIHELLRQFSADVNGVLDTGQLLT